MRFNVFKNIRLSVQLFALVLVLMTLDLLGEAGKILREIAPGIVTLLVLEDAAD